MQTNSRFHSMVDLGLIGMVFVLSLSIILLAWVPPVSRDALIHHLAVPKLWIEHGGIYEIPAYSFSYYPMNLDLLYTIPLLFNNDILPKIIHFIFGLLTGWLIYRYIEKRIGRTYGLLGALFFLSIPIVIKLGITVYVDLGLMFFSTAALLGVLDWLNNRYALKNLVLAAIFCGLALGTKYNALIVLFLLSLFVPFCYLRLSRGQKQSQFRAIGYFFIFISVSLVVFSPWMVKNYRWTKNPVYPLYGSWFDKKTTLHSLPAAPEMPSDGEATDDQSIGGWTHFTTRNYIYRETLGEILSIPLRIFFQGRDDDPKYFDGRLNPFLLLLPFLSFLNLKRDPTPFRVEKIVLMAFSVLYLLIAFLQTDMRIRYITPIIPPLVILSIWGLKTLFSTESSRGNGIASPYYQITGLVAVIWMLGLNTSYLYEQFKIVDPLPYISGKMGRDDYITRHRPEFPSIRYINTHLPEPSRILGVFMGNRGYYFDRKVIFDFSFLKKSVKETSGDIPLHEAFCRRKISHIILRRDLFDSWVKLTFNQNEIAVLKSFFRNHTRLLFSQAGYGVYAVINCIPIRKAMEQHVQ